MTGPARRRSSVRRPRARPRLVVVVLAASLLAAGAPVAAADDQAAPSASPVHPAPAVSEADVVAGSVVVRTDGPAGPARRAAVAAVAGGDPGQVVAPDTFVVRLPPDGDPAALAGAAGVAAVQQERRYEAAAVEPDDPCWRGSTCLDQLARPAVDGQVELRHVGAPQAWELSLGSPDVVVAVLDTRIETDPPHRDLVGKLLPGRSFLADARCVGPDARDHGTIAAGLIAAQPGNGIDMAGLGWDTRVLPVEVLDDCGNGTTAGVAAGVRWAADAGADVLNLSLTGSGPDPAVSSALAYARARGVLVVAAAGNQGGQRPAFPAADPGVVAVAATGVPGGADGDRVAPFSNRGTWVDIAAPGTDVTGLRRVGGSTNPTDGTTSGTGTSFAAPQVAAAAALVMAQDPSLTADQVVARLAQSAAPVAGLGQDVLWGRLDAAAALRPLPAGYRLVAADGGLFSFGDAPFAGSSVGRSRAPHVGAAGHVSGRGYWVARADGRVDAFGVAPAFPMPPQDRAAGPVVGIAATNGGDGYWLATRGGGVVAAGSAPHLGSATARSLNQPVVGLASGHPGDGYWLVASDGGVFSFGTAPFLGSTGGIRLNQPIVGMASTPGGAGYWLVARDGGIFAFGDAGFHGSTGAVRLNQPIVGMAPTRSGRGYWLVAADGGIFAFGDAAFLGSTGGLRLGQPVVGMTAR